MYVVDRYKIVDRVSAPRVEQREHSMRDMLRAIDTAQPARDQLGDYLEGREIAFVDDRLPNVEAAAELGWQAHHWVSDADTRVWLVGLGVI